MNLASGEVVGYASFYVFVAADGSVVAKRSLATAGKDQRFTDVFCPPMFSLAQIPGS